MQTFLSQLDWRFATKIFNPKKKVSRENLDRILEAIRKAPSSFGTQPFHVFVISNKKLRGKIRKVSFNQPQTIDASYLLIFCARNDIDTRIDNMIELMSGKDKVEKEKLSSLSFKLKNSIINKTKEKIMNDSSRQAYLALGFGLAACAELGIDSCPMEGFNSKALHKELNLPENIFPYAYLAIGYRKEGPARKKFRFPKTDLFTIKK